MQDVCKLIGVPSEFRTPEDRTDHSLSHIDERTQQQGRLSHDRLSAFNRGQITGQ